MELKLTYDTISTWELLENDKLIGEWVMGRSWEMGSIIKVSEASKWKEDTPLVLVTGSGLYGTSNYLKEITWSDEKFRRVPREYVNMRLKAAGIPTGETPINFEIFN
jgi:hypothetical protein